MTAETAGTADAAGGGRGESRGRRDEESRPGTGGAAGPGGPQAGDQAGDQGGDQAGADAAHWAPGTRVLWRYRSNGTGEVHICRPVTVVRDTPDLLAAWVAPGTVCVKPELADGTPVHHEPLATRYTKPRRTVLSRWFGTGVLKLARPGEPWSVWLFWERGWRFKNWYVNLESPRRRWAGGIDSEDHFLDIAVYPDGSWEWHDEDEFAAARQAGLVDDALAARVHEAGRSVVERIGAWAPPFRDAWEDWRPDPRWPVPVLPHDWDAGPPPGRAQQNEAVDGIGGKAFDGSAYASTDPETSPDEADTAEPAGPRGTHREPAPDPDPGATGARAPAPHAGARTPEARTPQSYTAETLAAGGDGGPAQSRRGERPGP